MALAGRTLSEMADPAAVDLARAERLVAQALAASPASPLGHFAKGEVLRAQGRPEEAALEYETAIASNRNFVYAISALAQCKLLTGSIEEVIPAQERAIRLSPRDPKIWLYHYWIGQAHLLRSRVGDAILYFEKARSANPEHALPHAYLASTYGLAGELRRAVVELAEARRLSGDDRYSSIARLRVLGPFGVPKLRALFEATYIAGLRNAGMQEE